MKPRGFRLNGKSFDAKATPAGVRKAVAFLDRLPDGDLLTSPELAAKIDCGYTNGHWHLISCHPFISPYKLAVRFPSKRVVWGNPKTIQELRKHKEILA